MTFGTIAVAFFQEGTSSLYPAQLGYNTRSNAGSFLIPLYQNKHDFPRIKKTFIIPALSTQNCLRASGEKTNTTSITLL
jgi:hypothetical protein